MYSILTDLGTVQCIPGKKEDEIQVTKDGSFLGTVTCVVPKIGDPVFVAIDKNGKRESLSTSSRGAAWLLKQESQ